MNNASTMEKPAKRRMVFWPVFLLFIAIAASIMFTGWIFYRAELKNARRAAMDELGVVGDLKVDEINAWRKERIADAELVAADAERAALAYDFMADRTSMLKANEVRRWMSSILIQGGYKNVALIDSNAVPLLWVGPGEPPAVFHEKDLAAKTIRECRPSLGDFHTSVASLGIHLDLFAPLKLPQPGASGRNATLRLPW